MIKLVVLAGALALLALGAFVVSTTFVGPAATPQALSDGTTANVPWVEVRASQVVEKNSDGETLRVLRSGDALKAGSVIVTDQAGLADIYFPDGSVTRLDGASELRIETAEFDAKQETLRVRLALLVGRTWSRVVALAGTESSWEVETANAVAVVRGTAFGVEYQNGASSLVVETDTVTFTPRDPETKTPLRELAVAVGEQEFVAVTDQDVPQLQKHISVLVPTRVPEEVRQAEWVIRSKARDRELDKRIDALREQGLEGKELRRQLREEVQKDQDTFLKERRESVTNRTEKQEDRVELKQEGDVAQEPNATNEQLPVRSGTERRDVENTIDQVMPARAEPVGTPAAPQLRDSTDAVSLPQRPPAPEKKEAARPESLRVEFTEIADITAVRIVEEDNIGVRAVLRMSDGTEQDVTQKVEWRVLGDIGSVDPQRGVFTPRLPVTVRELGKSFGNITATFVEADTGRTLFAPTPIFEVHTKIPDNVLERG